MPEAPSHHTEISKAIPREAIILAGGLGTRLRDTLPGIPKCMAPVAGRPFLFLLVNYLRSQGIEKFIFSLGFKHELIEEYLGLQFSTLDYTCSVEQEPLGTGGAIRLASNQSSAHEILLVNGDTLFELDLAGLTIVHRKNAADATLALKPMRSFDRYGVVDLGPNGFITGFHEKRFCGEGLINTGNYLLNRSAFSSETWPEKFSFETAFLESGKYRLCGSVQDAYFIDIGIPEDLEKANRDLTRPALDLSSIDREWTLFIDRDGVINHEKKDGYILDWGEFRFYEGVLEALASLSRRFGKIIIVSNQRGVGKGLQTERQLQDIHEKMVAEIIACGGRVDHIYYCTSTDNKDPDRKPNPGMAFRARRDFPGIDLSRSVMLGNKLSDMLFAKNAGIYAVFLASTNPETAFPHPDVDLRFDSLPGFVNSL